MIIEKKIKSILEQNDIKLCDLKNCLTNGSAQRFNGVGKKTVEQLHIYFQTDETYHHFNEYMGYFEKYFKFDNEEFQESALLHRVFQQLEDIRIMNLKEKYRIFEHQHENTSQDIIERVQQDPMILKDALNIKFKRIDDIALGNEWWTDNSFYRRKHLIVSKFEENLGTSTFLTDETITNICKNNKITQPRVINDLCSSLIDDGHIRKKIMNGGNIYILTHVHDIEHILYNMITTKCNKLKLDIPNHVDDSDSLSEEQKDAIDGCLSEEFAILTGGPGTGKTSKVIKGICEILEYNDMRVLFLAPTHAAKNRGKQALEDVDIRNVDFHTIHSMIFKHDDGSSILPKVISKYNMIIIDEASMIHSKQLLDVLVAIKYDSCFLLLVGDHNQLPPVSSGGNFGAPFRDLIDIVPTFRLTENFRAKESDIPVFLDRMLQPYSTFKLHNRNSVFKKPYTNIKSLFSKEYSKQLMELLIQCKHDGYEIYNAHNDKSKTLMVISPTNKLVQLSAKVVQQVYFPDTSSHDDFNVNDVVIMKKNTKLFKNGDYGTIIHINHRYKYKQYTIRLVEPSVKHAIDDDITQDADGNPIVSTHYFKTSYAITVHCAQGLAFNRVITIFDEKQTFNVTQKLIYTAISRARQEVFLLGHRGGYANKIDETPETYVRNLHANKLNDIISSPKKSSINIQETIVKKDTANLRKHLPKKLRNDVFTNTFGMEFIGKCYVCNEMITAYKFEVGHIQSVANGGGDNITNLKPICRACNGSMGTKNMEDYKKEYYH
uniref:AAA domain protein n=1 Tax=Megaviridae environmental sample TaxID=1737588 RepID=A0A5J6VJS9_9VIRU|nr:MAG: AAA domain protein [Megaviridae environmental sample]